LQVCWESTVDNYLFALLDLVFQVASKRRDVVELTRGEWVEDGKCNQVLDRCAILLLGKKRLTFGRLLCLGSQMA
jgi:hypothetical protein